jgi:hypothetical protein
MQLIKKNFLKKIYFIFLILNNLNIKIRLIYIKNGFYYEFDKFIKKYEN